MLRVNEDIDDEHPCIIITDNASILPHTRKSLKIKVHKMFFKQFFVEKNLSSKLKLISEGKEEQNKSGAQLWGLALLEGRKFAV